MSRMTLFGNGYLVALLTCAFLHGSLSGAAPATPADIQDSQLHLFSDVSVSDHPHFSTTIYIHETELNGPTMLMNGMEALADIALQDRNSRIRNFNYRLDDYPEAKISIIPKGTAPDFSYEVASLCLYYGIETLVRRNQYVEATFSCKWDGIEVARVDIDKANRVASGDLPSLTAKNTTMQTRDLGAITPNFRFRPGGHHLPLESIMVTLMYAFLQFSSKGAMTIVPRSSIQASIGWDVYLALKPETSKPKEPPYLNHRVAIETLRLMPVFLFERNLFREVTVDFRVNGLLLGTGSMLRGPMPQVADGGSNAAVATS